MVCVLSIDCRVAKHFFVIFKTNYQKKRKALMNLQENEDEDREATSFVEEFLLLMLV